MIFRGCVSTVMSRDVQEDVVTTWQNVPRSIHEVILAVVMTLATDEQWLVVHANVRQPVLSTSSEGVMC